MSVRSLANPVVAVHLEVPGADEAGAGSGTEGQYAGKQRLGVAGETSWAAWFPPSGAGDRIVSATEFEQRLHVWALLAHLTGTDLAVLLADVRSPDGKPGSAALHGTLGGETLVASRSEGGLQVLVWGASQRVVERLAGALLLRGGRRVRMGAAFVPTDATTAKSVLDMARSSLRRASSAQPLVYAANVEYRPPERRFASISPSMAAVARAIENTALGSAPLLLKGERGAGSEAVARTVHRWSSLRDEPFLSVDCELTPEPLVCRVIEAAFGASEVGRARPNGAFAGTLYLCRIEALTPVAQSLLVQYLELLEQTPGQRGTKRLVASTNRKLHELSEQRFFNPALYSLLTTTITVPALRERREDLKGLAEHFLDDIAVHLGRGPLVLSSEALKQLLAYPFPGNLPELRRELMLAATKSQSGELTTSSFSTEIRSLANLADAESSRSAEVEVFDLRRRVQAFEAQLIVRALDSCQWNQTEAAQRLNVPRRTLVYKMRQLGIRRASSR